MFLDAFGGFSLLWNCFSFPIGRTRCQPLLRSTVAPSFADFRVASQRWTRQNRVAVLFILQRGKRGNPGLFPCRFRLGFKPQITTLAVAAASSAQLLYEQSAACVVGSSVHTLDQDIWTPSHNENLSCLSRLSPFPLPNRNWGLPWRRGQSLNCVSNTVHFSFQHFQLPLRLFSFKRRGPIFVTDCCRFLRPGARDTVLCIATCPASFLLPVQNKCGERPRRHSCVCVRCMYTREFAVIDTAPRFGLRPSSFTR